MEKKFLDIGNQMIPGDEAVLAFEDAQETARRVTFIKEYPFHFLFEIIPEEGAKSFLVCVPHASIYCKSTQVLLKKTNTCLELTPAFVIPIFD